MNDKFGLKQKDFKLILEVLGKFPSVKKAYIFGSRAKGNYKKGSDIDLAIFSDPKTIDVANRVAIQLNEYTSLPYIVDVVNYYSTENEALKKHIDTFGVLIYELE